jgi:hypothetical protein
MSKWLRLIAILGISAAAAAQTGKAPAPSTKPHATPAKKSSAPAASADHSEAVITIQNLCPQKQTGPACRTVITKDQFDALMKSAKVPPTARRQAAEQLVKIITLATSGEKMGLQDTSAVKERLYLMRLQTLAGAYDEYLKENKAQVSEADARKYYDENTDAYEEVTLRRLFIPKPPQGGDKKPGLDEAATKQLADKMHERAVAGEDFDKLEQEVFAATVPDMAKTAVPTTTMGPVRRGLGAPPQHEAELFGLKPGQVSTVYDEPTSFVMYKVESRRTVPFDDVKSQIIPKLGQQKLQDVLQATFDSVKTTYNDEYFKPAEKPNVGQHPASVPGMPAPGATPAKEGTQPKPAAEAPAQTPPVPQQTPAATPPAPK